MEDIRALKDKNRRFAFRFEYSLVLFVVLFVLSAAFNIWRAKFGYFSRDESLYLAIPYRMLQGDLLLLHEWDSTQMSAALLCSSFSMWFWTGDPIQYNKQRLEEYWGLFPEKKPDYIYFDKEQSSDPEFLNAFETEKYKKMHLEEGFVLCLHE